ncbi:MAG: 30S ribosome-binding factor RbfA [Dehalococcoidia bacterium]
MTRRTERVNDLLREEISDLLQHGLKDPRLGGLVTVTEVDVAPDLRHAKVFVSVLGSAEEQLSTFEGLAAASHYMQRELRKRLTMRRTPELAFVPDRSLEHGAHILKLLDRARKSDAS